MLRRLALITASLFFATSAGCKQGAGERCQVNADCEDGLVCSASTPSICVVPGTVGGSRDGGVPDAEEPIDAFTPDGPLPQCSNGLDDDGDDLIDFGDDAKTNDPECDSADDDDESA